MRYKIAILILIVICWIPVFTIGEWLFHLMSWSDFLFGVRWPYRLPFWLFRIPWPWEDPGFDIYAFDTEGRTCLHPCAVFGAVIGVPAMLATMAFLACGVSELHDALANAARKAANSAKIKEQRKTQEEESWRSGEEV